jgi:formate hydrogenlyase subunit 3/multisubunit Na+/H+ antiporter MnhD subunit
VLSEALSANQRHVMSEIALMLIAIFAVCIVGGIVGSIIPDRWNPLLLGWTGSLASLLTLYVGGDVLWSGKPFRCELWTIRGLGTLVTSLDRLSALFLLVAGVVVLASSIYSVSYLQRYSGRYSLKALTVWYLVLYASIVLVLISNDLLTFLLAWEVMSVSSYLLVTFDYERDETSRASYLMLTMGEVGFIAVAILLLFLATKSGALEFPALKSVAIGLKPVQRWLVFLVTFFGFGTKAGLVPFNTWLPRAHPAAPANVSAILSGVILNLGLYGIIRVNLDLVPVNMVWAGVAIARSPVAEKANEAPRCMTAPMVFLALLCLLFGVLPTMVIPALNRILLILNQTSSQHRYCTIVEMRTHSDRSDEKLLSGGTWRRDW